MADSSEALHPLSALFWDLAQPHLASGDVEEGTMMGTRCLRRSGTFVAMVWESADRFVLKLPAARVDALIEDGVGEAFSPNGKRFKEWLGVATADEFVWKGLLVEAVAFAAPSA